MEAVEAALCEGWSSPCRRRAGTPGEEECGLLGVLGAALWLPC